MLTGGDEGKGRIVDYLADQASASIRFQGGNNAGHTVVNDFGTFKLHQLPSGVFNPDCIAVLGPGMVISPAPLTEELAEVKAAGVNVNMRISDRATLCLPLHAIEDTLEEERLGDGGLWFDTSGHSTRLWRPSDEERYLGRLAQAA